MPQRTRTTFHAFLYGAASALLALDLFFLARSIIRANFVPIVPIVAGIFATSGLLFVLYAEMRTRKQDRQEHRRLSRVAHQLESPIKALQQDLEYLVRRADALPAEDRMKIKRMETKTRVLLENVRDVFLMFRAHDGGVSGDARAYDACTLLKDIIDEAQQEASAKNIELTYTTHCEHAPVMIDKSLFMLVMRHILDNAMTYTLKPGYVNVAVIKGKSRVRIVIQDRGVGIKRKDEDVIFEPFARGAKADQFDSDGIGVGLTLSRLIIREWNGMLIWRHRGNQAGSEFEVQLPLEKQIKS